jgi:hypothetical protein
MTASAPPSAETLRPDEEALVQYAAVSKAALVALALGLASPLILVAPLLLVVPLAGIVVAAVALRQIATSEPRLTGYWPATIGLCLSTLFLGWGATHQVTRQAVLASQAERLADGWLALVRDGKLQRADQMKRPAGERPRSDEELAEFYSADQEARDNLQSFFASEPMKSFLAAGPQVNYRHIRIAGQLRYGLTDQIVLEYRYQTKGGESRTMWITVMRTGRADGRPADWQVHAASDVLPMTVQ